MERIQALINKLQEQLQHADASEMMITVQILQAELARCSSFVPKQMGTSKVAVVMPSSNKIPPSSNKAATSAREPVALPVEVNSEEPVLSENMEGAFEPSKKIAELHMATENPKNQGQSGWLFDPVQEIPTLAHQKEFREMNDVFGQMGSSLNDTLKTEKKELASLLNQAPVRDLKKAIGVNDRFVFLSELFRGDEAMYERSIKTINNFRIYAEAEYWIERELKVKLGWDESKDAVKQFRQLVKRRFS